MTIWCWRSAIRVVVLPDGVSRRTLVVSVWSACKNDCRSMAATCETGPRKGGGFEVRGAPPPSRSRPGQLKPDGQDNSANRWFDPVLAMILLILCELEVLADLHRDGGHNHWPMTINALLVAGMTIPIIWRRRLQRSPAALSSSRSRSS